MKRARHDSQFVDLEAMEEEAEEGEDHDLFVVEPTDETLYTPWRHFEELDENSNEGGWSDLVASLEERFVSGSRTTQNIADSNHRDEPPDPIIAACIDNITRLPTKDDYPLWRVRCKPRLETDIVFFLMQKVSPQHELRSAFATPSIRGWVYLEATFNNHLRNLLALTPGVIRDRCGLVAQHIPDDQRLETLKIRPSEEPPQIGKWVRVLSGTYKGDVAFVLSTSASEVLLLLIPRLATPDALHSKRKRGGNLTTKFGLFDLETVKKHYDIQPLGIDDKTYSFRNARFEHGLIVRSYRFDSVSTAVSTIPLESFGFFRLSGHPKLTAEKFKFPRPTEWCFAEGDEVYVVDNSYPASYKSGIITKLRDDSAELDTEVVVPWVAICKVIRVGDYVEVTGGMHKGQSGWVVNMDLYDHLVDVIFVVNEEKILESTQVHANLLRRIDVPSVLGKPPGRASAVPQHGQVPWIDVEVRITHGHAMKGYSAVVKDVLCNQQTPSGLRLLIQLTSLDPNSPFSRMTVDYDHVVEAQRQVQLHHFLLPKSVVFMPRTNKPAKSLPTMIHQPLHTPGGATPFPESCLSSSPAWDPSSRTPQLNPDYSGSPCRSSSSRSVDPEHALLDARLSNVKLRVIVDGGDYKNKELTASIFTADGRLSIRRPKYNTFEYFHPDWVTPKHPHPKRDNGLLVVIKGEHLGKTVRRIRHQFDEDGNVFLMLVVVNSVEGQVDTLTGDLLQMNASHLCVCNESPEFRKDNDLLMKPLREEARNVAKY